MFECHGVRKQTDHLDNTNALRTTKLSVEFWGKITGHFQAYETGSKDQLVFCTEGLCYCMQPVSRQV